MPDVRVGTRSAVATVGQARAADVTGGAAALLRRCVATGTALLLCADVAAATFPMPPDGEDLVGEAGTVITSEADTLLDIGRRHGLGYGEMAAANPGIDPWVPGEATEVRLPTQFILPSGPRRGIVINLAQMRLFYFPPAKRGQPREVVTYPLGVGRESRLPPLAESRVVRKASNPIWFPPASIRAERRKEGEELPRAVPPGPDNPLGEYALYLDLPGYLIHGTNRPWGIGMRVTGGCIRLYPEDIAALHAAVPVGTPVRITHEPFVLGRHAGALYLKVFPPLGEDVESEGRDHTPLVKAVLRRARKGDRVDWDAVMRAAHERLGLAVRITLPAH
jgi:L,D-transpeptidase ErfK/SrfK